MTEIHIQKCLGRGGFGEVYKGLMSRPGGVEVDVAIKVIRGDLEESSQGIERLRDEGRLLGRLTHPTILRVYDLVFIEGRPALVSEYVAGEDLGRLIREDSISPRAAFEVIAQVAAALDAAWSWPSVTDGKALHLVHRDIKPDNIRIDPHGAVKLLDFGIAQAKTVEREARTSNNTIMGSTQYLAPERLVQQEVGPESDVFALGCTLFEMLTGEALFARRSMRQMYLLMVNEERFEQFLAERCGTYRERLVSDHSIALIRAMTCWKKGSRPTAAEVGSRCDALSDTAQGLTLTQWCRSRVWRSPPQIDGPLDGKTFGVSPAEESDDFSIASLAGAEAVLPQESAQTSAEPSTPVRVPQLDRQWPEPKSPRTGKVTAPPLRPDPLPLEPLVMGPSSGPVNHVPMPEDAVTVASTPAFPSIPPAPPADYEDESPTAVGPSPSGLPSPESQPTVGAPVLTSEALTPVAFLGSLPLRSEADDVTDPTTQRVMPPTALVPDLPEDPEAFVELPTVRIQRSSALAAGLEESGDQTVRSDTDLVDLTLPGPEPTLVDAEQPVEKQLPVVRSAPPDPIPTRPPPRKRSHRFGSEEFRAVGIRFVGSLAGLVVGTMVLLVVMVVALIVSHG